MVQAGERADSLCPGHAGAKASGLQEGGRKSVAVAQAGGGDSVDHSSGHAGREGKTCKFSRS